MTLTLGCGIQDNNFTIDNLHWKHFLNITQVSKPIPLVIPDEEKLFGAHWEKYGKSKEIVSLLTR